jgi:hypothetical protein
MLQIVMVNNIDVQVLEGRMPGPNGAPIDVKIIKAIDMDSGQHIDIPLTTETARRIGNALAGRDIKIATALPPNLQR